MAAGFQRRMKPTFCHRPLHGTLAGMRISELTQEQLAAIESTIGPTLDYLNQLQRWMQNRFFPDDDPLCSSAREGKLALQALLNEIRCAHVYAPTISLPISRRLVRPRRPKTH
jgi:hypothetical protein